MNDIVEYIIYDGICTWQVVLAENVKNDVQRKIWSAQCIIYNTRWVS
jgi:hypothetical protein